MIMTILKALGVGSLADWFSNAENIIIIFTARDNSFKLKLRTIRCNYSEYSLEDKYAFAPGERISSSILSVEMSCYNAGKAPIDIKEMGICIESKEHRTWGTLQRIC